MMKKKKGERERRKKDRKNLTKYKQSMDIRKCDIEFNKSSEMLSWTSTLKSYNSVTATLLFLEDNIVLLDYFWSATNR